MKDSVVLLVSCGKHKCNSPCQAKDMYNSYRFQKLKMVAEKSNMKWYILSAQYGLLSPDDIIEPYDLCITNCAVDYKKWWANNIVQELSRYSKDTLFVVAANEDYTQYIVPMLIAKGFRVSAPFIGRDENTVSDYLEKEFHIDETIELYKCICEVSEKTGGIRIFNECTGKMYWPQRGVYFFVDFSEKSLVSNGFPRIVRVGTHAVSKGAKTTLWNRLKTHKGTNQGGGNHRGSIFRLHVGNAIIKKEGLICDTWGVGQNATQEIREKEKKIEQLVSEYIGQLGVIVIDVDDLPSAVSARAFIEKNSIALLSSLNSSFNFSTVDWLGNYSPRNEIVNSCLWNINHIGHNYDEDFMKKLWEYADNTIINYKR